MWIKIKDLFGRYREKPRIRELEIEEKLNRFLKKEYPGFSDLSVKVKKATSGVILIKISSPLIKNELRMREKDIKKYLPENKKIKLI